MRKYRSTDSHYLELATCNYNFGNLKKSTSSSSSAFTYSKATIRPLEWKPEEQIPFIRENTQPEEQSHFHRLPDDIFISEEPLHHPTRQHFSIFKSINTYKRVSYTMMDKTKSVVHCFMEEKDPTSIQCCSWSKLADRFSNTAFAPLAQTIQEFYMKREDWNESLSMSTKEESYQALPEYSNNGMVMNPNGHIFLNQFQLAQEREDVNYIEKILSNPHNQQPQLVFRRMYIAGKGTILRSLHINTSFLNMVNCSTEDFLLCTAVRKAIPDIFYSLNYMEIMKNTLFKIDNSQQQDVFNHSILTANHQQVDIQCRYEGANMPNSKLVVFKITNSPSIQYKFPSPVNTAASSSTSIEQSGATSINKKRKLFEREDVIINSNQQRILQIAFGIKLEDSSSQNNNTSSSQVDSNNKLASPQQKHMVYNDGAVTPSKKSEMINQQLQQQTNDQVNQIEKIFKLRMNNY